MSNKKTNPWVKFDPAVTGAETPFLIKIGEEETRVILNQHNQVLDADTRRLIEVAPTEMQLIEPEKVETPPAS